MNRKQFIGSLGAAGAASLLPFSKVCKANNPPNECVLIPSETAGPFPLDLSENETFFRQDVREDRTGVLLYLKMKIVGLENCLPMQNVRVNIWHCDRNGIYSGYNTNNNPGNANTTFLRGYQFTNANGEVDFVTIFPGWYNGRICHIHFQVYVSSMYSAVSQLTFPISAKNEIYQNNSDLYPKGADPETFNSDMIFRDSVEYQTATLTPNTNTGGYDSYLEVTVQGSGVTNVGYYEQQIAKYFTLEQNQPNPFNKETIIPLQLHQSSEVQLELFDLSGKKCLQRSYGRLSSGQHALPLTLINNNLPKASYVYRVTVSNTAGIFHQCKVMTANN